MRSTSKNGKMNWQGRQFLSEPEKVSEKRPQHNTYIALSCVSTAATIAVLASMLSTKVMFRRSAVVLILFLNASQLVQDLVSFPYYLLATVIEPVCEGLGFFRAYSELMDICICFCMVLTNYLLLFDEEYKTLYFSKLDRRIVMFLCLFPLITLLPFINRAYGEAVTGFCSFRLDHTSEMWSVASLYTWVWATILATIYSFIYVWWKLKFDPRLQGRYLRSLGVYPLVSILVWIPRSIVRMSQFLGINPAFLAIVISHVLTYVVGLIYAIVYLFERSNILRFASEARTVSEINLESWGKSFGSVRSSDKSEARPSESSVYEITLMQVSSDNLNGKFGDVESPLA